jgi:hypothetical protein
MALQFTTAVRNARQDAITTAAGNAALLRIYDGTPPASANAALSGNTKLAELVMGTPFAAGAASGALTAGAISNDSSADATGTASFFRVYKSDGTTVIAQGTVGTSGADLNLNTTSIVAGGPVAVSSLVWTDGNA